MTTQERRLVQSEIGALKKMLAQLPESSVIDRMSLEARKRSLEKELASQRQAGAEEVPPGYKRTEVGVVPEDWRVAQIINVLENFIDYRGRTPRKLGMEWGGGNIPALSARNVKMGFIDLSQETNYGSDALYKRWMTSGTPKRGDIVVTLEAPLGNVAQIPEDRKYILSQRTILLQLDTKRVTNEYLFHYIASAFFQKILQENATGTTASGIKRSKFEKLQILIPPLPEQRAIAAALSDADRLIGALDALIEKKRAIKQATMQQLLTGKKRLPGFSGEWETKRLGDILAFLPTANNPRADLTDNGDMQYIHYGDVHAQTKPILDCNACALPSIDRRKVGNAAYLEDGDLIMVDASEDLEGTGKSVEVQGVTGKHVIAGLHTIFCRGNSDQWARGFKAYLQFIPAFKFTLTRIATGISVYAISKKQIAEIELALPSVPEQEAIVSILSDMDAEITALERRREKAEQIKQGMMQQLLTGRIRLVEPPEVGA